MVRVGKDGLDADERELLASSRRLVEKDLKEWPFGGREYWRREVDAGRAFASFEPGDESRRAFAIADALFELAVNDIDRLTNKRFDV